MPRHRVATGHQVEALAEQRAHDLVRLGLGCDAEENIVLGVIDNVVLGKECHIEFVARIQFCGWRGYACDDRFRWVGIKKGESEDGESGERIDPHRVEMQNAVCFEKIEKD